MKNSACFISMIMFMLSCGTSSTQENNAKDSSAISTIAIAASPIEGTWKLISATNIKKADTTVTDFTKGQEMIKVINGSHFAFLRHDMNQGKDTAIFGAGGGTYTLSGDQYTELLQYCNERGWEGHTFSFTVSVKEDTLLQTGVENIPKENVNQYIIEKYVRIK